MYLLLKASWVKVIIFKYSKTPMPGYITETLKKSGRHSLCKSMMIAWVYALQITGTRATLVHWDMPGYQAIHLQMHLLGWKDSYI